MANRKLSDLRDHLFDALEKLKDKDTPMEVERAEAIAHVSAQIINSAKLELQFITNLNQGMLPETASPKDAAEFFTTPRKQLPAANGHTIPQRGLGTGKSLGREV